MVQQNSCIQAMSQNDECLINVMNYSISANEYKNLVRIFRDFWYYFCFISKTIATIYRCFKWLLEKQRWSQQHTVISNQMIIVVCVLVTFTIHRATVISALLSLRFNLSNMTYIYSIYLYWQHRFANTRNKSEQKFASFLNNLC